MLNKNKIQIAMLELSAQTRAVLEFYFNNAGENIFTLVSEDKADAFIIDYDFPGAKDTVTHRLSESKKPIVILSIREQELPSAIYLAKPLSAVALSKAAEQIQQIITENKSTPFKNTAIEEKAVDVNVVKPSVIEEQVADVSAVESLIINEPVIEDKIEETIEKVKPETVKIEVQKPVIEQKVAVVSGDVGVGVDIKMPMLEDDHDVSDGNDIFDTLTEDNKDVGEDESKKIEARLSAPSAEALLSISNSNKNESDSKKLQKKLNNTQINDNLNIDFTDIMIDVENTQEAGNESEIDALLAALISGDGNEKQESTVTNIASDKLVNNIPNSKDTNPKNSKDIKPEPAKPVDDIFLETLSLDSKVIDEVANKKQVLTPINKKPKAASKPASNEKMVTPEQNSIELDALELLDESIVVEDKNPIVTEKESVLLAENFTSNDINPIEEASSSGMFDIENNDQQDASLMIDPAKFKKTVEKQTLTLEETPIELKLETLPDQIPVEEKNDDIGMRLDLDLFDKDAETVKGSLELIKPSKIETEDLSIPSIDKSIDTDNFEGDATKPDENAPHLIEMASLKIKKAKAIKKDFEKNNGSSVLDKDSADFDLQSLLNEVREEASHMDDDFGDSSGNRKYKTTDAEKRWSQLCGENNAISSQKEVSKLLFIPKNHLLNVLLEQIKSIKTSEQMYRIKYHDLIIVIDQSEDCIYCNLPIIDDEFAEICSAEVDDKKIKVHDLDYSEVRLYRTKIKENPDRAHTIESFTWSMSLLTSRGRLPKGTDVIKKIGLKTWPNLTRVELPPNAIQIAAVLSNHPGNLLEISRWLNIEQRFVFAFFNAALSLNMIELDNSKIKTPSINFNKKNPEGKEQRSFFGRLMKRLKS